MLKDMLPMVRGIYRENFSLASSNWFRVGGAAEIVFRPADLKDLQYFLANKPKNIPIIVLGVGSNILIRDGGIDGIVIKLGRNFANITVEGEFIKAGAGALDYNVALFARDHHYSGFEFLSGIPGTIGGALAMNAGAYHSEIAHLVHQVQAVDLNGNIKQFSSEECGWRYRGNNLDKSYIFTEAVFHTAPGEYEMIQSKIAEIQMARSDTQPIKSRTSGSTFKNPPGYKAWQLIDQAGCRGLVIGDAEVSSKHCNFFINRGQAKAADIESLIHIVQERVLQKTGILLEPEIKIIGKS